ncbi:hypothetical protein PPERSA_04716 [Pseudocohnilembus persalinus]|uniref:Uncharacterized protein n=1 Tax=Pseudocohnilembus persalinus TaxID=266149 RepID=A0A0V0R4K1_PSEPJ|nr:hypothetical protein PPERSA_04716 [Pseudocohnilembus persalinus]|eukprot:KRX09410.1 hypothetical protein PPERSA_04716 [Pseudocohnilembus persalinus]
MELMKIFVKEGKMIYKQLDPENNFYEILKYLSYVNQSCIMIDSIDLQNQFDKNENYINHYVRCNIIPIFFCVFDKFEENQFENNQQLQDQYCDILDKIENDSIKIDQIN